MTKALVTGGAGFIGSHLVEALLEKDYTVRILDDFSTGKRENLLAYQNEVEIFEGDLADQKVVFQAVEGVNCIFHMGAIPSVVRSVEDPFRVHQANVQGTLNVLLAARQMKVKRVVYSSSSSIYGDQPTLPKEESMKPDPISPYAATKLAGEVYSSVFYSVYRVPTVSLRYFNVFGPRQDPRSLYSAVIPRFIDRLVDEKPPTIYGDGMQTRDFTYVGDVVRANLLACDASDHVLGKAYNIACGKFVSLLELLNQIQEIINVKVSPAFESARSGDIRDSWASIEAAKRDLNFNPVTPLAQGLKKTIDWFLLMRNTVK